MSAEPIFDYYLDGSRSDYLGWHFKADRFGPQTPYAPGDKIIALLAGRTDDQTPGWSPMPAGPIGITGPLDGSDWINRVDVQFDVAAGDDPDMIHFGSHNSVQLWEKTWGSGDPTDYEAFFPTLPTTITDPDAPGIEGEVQMIMYAMHGGGTFTAWDESGPYTDTSDSFTRTHNYGDGATSWAYQQDIDHDIFGIWGYHPKDVWFYYGDAKVYGAVSFGTWVFTGFDFEPAGNIDEGFGEGGTNTVTGGREPHQSITLQMVNFLSTGVRADRRVGQIHRISVA